MDAHRDASLQGMKLIMRKKQHNNAMKFGERAADRFAAVVGSWSFIMLQTFCLVSWVLYNIIYPDIFDKYPFILLNLVLSFQAAYTGPILLMSANRQSKIDRNRAIKNLKIDQDAHSLIIALEKHIDNHFHKLIHDILSNPEALKSLQSESHT
jgi:uncharacterized membrane protein